MKFFNISIKAKLMNDQVFYPEYIMVAKVNNSFLSCLLVNLSNHIYNAERKEMYMEFDEETIALAFIRSRGRCECIRSSHHHFAVRCDNDLLIDKRGVNKLGGWFVHSKVKNAGNSLSNCEILCWECCEKIHEKY
jgi:hypothetical protein